MKIKNEMLWRWTNYDFHFRKNYPFKTTDLSSFAQRGHLKNLQRWHHLGLSPSALIVVFFSLSLSFSLSHCLSHHDIPVFVLYCLSLSFEASFTSVRSRGFYTQPFLKGDKLLCLLLHSPSPLFWAPLLFHYQLSIFYFHDTLSPVRMPQLMWHRPCGAMF